MTKILHSKYGYFILVMKGLTEEFFLPKIVYGQFQDGAELSFSESSVLVTTLLHVSIPVTSTSSSRTNRRNRGESQYLRKVSVITILSKFVCLILCFYRSLQLVNFAFYRSLQLTERQHRKTILTAFIGS